MSPTAVGPTKKKPKNPGQSEKARLWQATWEATQYMTREEIHEFVDRTIDEVESDAP